MTTTTPDIFGELENIASEEQEQKKFDLGPISRLGDQQAQLEAKANDDRVEMIYNYASSLGASVADIEEAGKRRGKELFQIKQVQIPELMAEYGLESITTSSGVQLKIMGDVSVTKKDEYKLFAFIRDKGCGDLIKNQVIISIGDEKQRKEVIDLLDGTDYAYESKSTVHAQTLKKFVKDQRANGVNIPEDAVKVFEYKVTKLKK